MNYLFEEREIAWQGAPDDIKIPRPSMMQAEYGGK